VAHILVVDDDRDLRGTIAKVLARAGHSVTEAGDGLDALNLVGTHPFAIALVDLFMPQMDGLELIPKLQLQSPATKIVAMSGGVFGGKAVDLLRSAERLGAVRTLVKPFEMDALLALLEELLAD
jgi:CheY-like chemotaxis protein